MIFPLSSYFLTSFNANFTSLQLSDMLELICVIMLVLCVRRLLEIATLQVKQNDRAQQDFQNEENAQLVEFTCFTKLRCHG